MIGWLKLAGIGLVAAGLLAIGLIVKGWKDDAEKVPLLKDQLERSAWALERRIQSEKDVQAASEGYQNELKDLKAARASIPTRVVRLCVLSDGPGPGAADAAEPGPDGAATGTGVVSEGAGSNHQPGPDIGGRLYELADRADELAAQVRGLQDYINRQQAERANNGG